MDEVESDLVSAKSNLEAAKSDQKAAVHQLDSHCRNQAKFIKELLRGSSGNPYNNYDKRDYSKSAEAMARDSDHAEYLLSDAGLESARSLQSGKSMPALSQEGWQDLDLQGLIQRTQQLASRSVSSQALDGLRDDADLAEWVRQGMDHHVRRELSRCAFCDHTISKSRIEKLRLHFSTELIELHVELDALSKSISNATVLVNAMESPGAEQFFEPLGARRNRLGHELSKFQSCARALLAQLESEVERKRAHPFDRNDVEFADPQIPDPAVLGKLGNLVTEHNHTVSEFENRSIQARESLEKHFVAAGAKEYVEALGRTVEAEALVTKLATSVKSLANESKRLQSELTQHRTPAEELNVDLSQYVGHKDIWLEIEDNGYKVVRQGVPTSECSEGEVTAIALLYFLKSLDDVRFDSKKGVVVLDDPVSSLDANALYLAYAVIRERTADAGQLFVMTHNFTFFRQVRNWFRHLPGQRSDIVDRRPARFYMINCTSGAGGRNSTIDQLDPLLEKYESDYHYLFAKVLECATQPGMSLETVYALPNMARRLLEAFLAFRRPDIRGGLARKIQAIEFDEAKKAKILRFVHTYSHGDAVGEPEHDVSLLGEAPNVLNDLLELMKSEDSGHVRGMTKLVIDESR